MNDERATDICEACGSEHTVQSQRVKFFDGPDKDDVVWICDDCVAEFESENDFGLGDGVLDCETFDALQRWAAAERARTIGGGQ